MATTFSTTRFVKMHYTEAEFEAAGVPAILAYRGGDKFAGFVPVSDEIPDHEDLSATSLRNSTMNYARDHLSSQVKGELKVVARMYANVRGLAEACTRAGLVSAKEVMEDFMRGFSKGDPLFDCVDVGPGTDRVDEKISG